VSKERAHRRAQRERLARERELAQQQARLRAQRRARRRARWQWLLPRRRAVDPRVRERRALIGSVLLVLGVLTYLATQSVALTIGVLAVALIATPALLTLVSDKRR